MSRLVGTDEQHLCIWEQERKIAASVIREQKKVVQQGIIIRV
jgi:hypothetical protein